MNKIYLNKIVLACTLLFIGFCLHAQTASNVYKGAPIYPNVVQVKFVDEPTLTNKIEMACLNETLLKSSNSDINYLAVSGLAQLNSLNESYSAIKMKRVFRDAGKHEQKHREFGLHLWYEIEYADGVDLTEAISSYAKVDYIQLVSPIYTTEQHGVLTDDINDPIYSYQWHFENFSHFGYGTTGADIDLEKAWTIETGNSKLIVAINDGGIDVDHSDLAGNVWVNAGEIAGNGIDDDNNGYIDDVNGYNFVDDQGAIVALDHGTHVAGTIGAETNNGIGVAGIAGGTGNDDGVKLMSCQVFSDDNADGFSECFIYSADNGAVISQNSWGYPIPGTYNQSDLDAIDYFIATAGGAGEAMQGGLVISSAGNSGDDNTYYPANYAPVVAVAATDNNDNLSTYSCYGDWVDISAPGGEGASYESVYSTKSNNSYGFLSGTSMACPHVSGVAALIVSQNYGDITALELRTILETSTENIDSLNPDYAGLMGTGRLNAYLALTNEEEPLPGIANSPKPSNGKTDVMTMKTLSWSAGDLAYQHNVYFGTESDPEFIKTQNTLTFFQDTLEINTTYYWRIDEVNGFDTTKGEVWSFTTDDGSNLGYAPLPYYTGFESGEIDDYWVLIADTTDGRLYINSENSPIGNYHLTSDMYEGGEFGINEAWLKVNLEGEENVDLSFFWKEFGDEYHEEDGVFFSDDAGENFVLVHSLTDGSDAYEQIILNVDELASENGLELSNTFVIKFQQMDNYYIPSDGFAYDNIAVGTSVLSDTFKVDLELVFDQYPAETSWEISDVDELVIESGNGYKYQDGDLNLSVYLPVGCYFFTVFDSYDDGMCCTYGDGSYTFSQNSVVLASGGSFESSETTEFCISYYETESQESAVNEVEETSSTQSISENTAIKLYPNHTSTSFVIETKYTSESQSTYSIRDMSGKTLVTETITDNKTRVDVSEFSAGMYLVNVSVGDNIETHKLIKN